ncbi:MAG: glycosyltransferase family 4 protein [Desulfobacteraceae bacterium]|nr:glycosyltransferase family 4 protein [Desulfobacteraceae bacterium]
MHIAMVTCFSKDAEHIEGGVAGVAKYLADELAKNEDIELSIVVPKANPGRTICTEWPGYKVYRVGIKRIWSFLPGIIYDTLIGRRKLNAVLRQINPDLVHYQGYCFLSANCQFPYILTVHGIAEYDALWSAGPLVRWFKWLVFRMAENHGRCRAPYIILISRYVQQFLPEKNNLKKTWLIENPIANSYFNDDWQFEAGRIFYCGSLIPRKNTLGLLKSFILIVKDFPDAQLRLAGPAYHDYLTKCRDFVDKCRLDGKVHFLGNLSIKGVQEELVKANCLVIPSFQETAPLTIEEAMAVGVPVVGARVGGIPEMVEDGKTGFLVDPYDTNSIYLAVSKILSDETLARSMGHCAREVARKRFMASVVCDRTLQAYRSILSEKI